jgi:hypothetical protein
MRDLNEANVREALEEVGGPPAVLVCGAGVPELIARRICQDGDRPAVVSGIEVRTDAWIAGWRMEKTDG